MTVQQVMKKIDSLRGLREEISDAYGRTKVDGSVTISSETSDNIVRVLLEYEDALLKLQVKG